MRKQMLENECKQLRRELGTFDDLKKSAEQQSRNYEQEVSVCCLCCPRVGFIGSRFGFQLRKLEAELRSRESREGTEVLMNALQAMQDKNSTLEKNLSAETRVKLDLFSALGEAKRQLEIRDSKWTAIPRHPLPIATNLLSFSDIIRQKDKEVQDVQAKIAQLFAVMPSVPNDSFMSQCTATGSSILRLNDATLQGPSSPMSHAHISLGGSPLMNQLQNLSVYTSTSSSTSPQQNSTSQVSSQSDQQQNNPLDSSSGLDPNATAYTPKNEV